MHHSPLKIAVTVTLAALASAAGATAGPHAGAPPRGAAGESTSAAKAASSPLREAVALVRSKGYTPDSTRHYKPWATLRVLDRIP